MVHNAPHPYTVSFLILGSKMIIEARSMPWVINWLVDKPDHYAHIYFWNVPFQI